MTSLELRTKQSKIIVGYTTRLHLLLDVDFCTKSQGVILGRYVMEIYPEVGDCLICKTNRGRHLIFDNVIGYNKAYAITVQLAVEGWLEKDYVRIRTFHGDMTLRVSERWENRGYAPPPKPLMILSNNYCERHDGMIGEYLDVLRIGVRLSFNYQRFCS